MNYPPIQMLAENFVDVRPMLAALDANPQVWNQHTARLKQYAHSGVSDIWVRYRSYKDWTGDLGEFNNAHEAVWYPVADILPVREIVYKVMTAVEGERLGGVLITRIPPGGSVKPHVDRGWHASHYDKFAIQLAGNAAQGFCFKAARLTPLAGDLYAFNNSLTHWVENPSDEHRITLIICIRTRRTGLEPIGCLARKEPITS